MNVTWIMGSLAGLSWPENAYNLHFHKAQEFPFVDANAWTAWLQLHYYIQDCFFSLSLPRGLLLLLGITGNKKEQAVKPNDLDGIASNLLQAANVHDPGQTMARSLLQSQEGQT